MAGQAWQGWVGSGTEWRGRPRQAWRVPAALGMARTGRAGMAG